MWETSWRAPWQMPSNRARRRPAASRFQAAARATPSLARHVRAGLQALRPVDAAKVSAKRTLGFTGSVDVDGALAEMLPNDARWDYAIGYASTASGEHILWVEVHPADAGGNAREIEAKHAWLVRWLKSEAPAMNYAPRRFIWIASGKSSYTANDPKLRALRNRGVEFVGSRLRLP